MWKSAREGTAIKLLGNQNPRPKVLLRSERKGSDGDVRRGATVRGVMEKSWSVGVVERKKVRSHDPIDYFLPTRVRNTF